jgi:hypothetical protein
MRGEQRVVQEENLEWIVVSDTLCRLFTLTMVFVIDYNSGDYNITGYDRPGMPAMAVSRDLRHIVY